MPKRSKIFKRPLPTRSPRRLGVEMLEKRDLLAVGLVSAADPDVTPTLSAGGLLRLSEQPLNQAAPKSISADGRYMVFTSSAVDIVRQDFNGDYDVFRFDRLTGAIDLVSIGIHGKSGSSGSYGPNISDDGQKVVFSSDSSDLVANDRNGTTDVFVRDFSGATPVTRIVSVNTTATGSGNGPSYDPVISGDGSTVAFVSSASDLAVGDANNAEDVFVSNITTGSPNPVLVSINFSGTGTGNRESGNPSISDDGRVIAFDSRAGDLISTDSGAFANVFMRDYREPTPVTRLMSVNLSGTAGGNDNSRHPQVSGDGSRVVFASTASDLVAGDANGQWGMDIFVRDVDPPTSMVELVSRNMEGTNSANGLSSNPVISRDGMVVAFQSDAADLVDTDSNASTDVFVTEWSGGTSTTTLVSLNADGTDSGNDSSYSPQMSADGSIISFNSAANDLVPSDRDGTTDVFVRDRTVNATSSASTNQTGNQTGSFASTESAVSGDGRYVLFQSGAFDLVVADGNGRTDVFVRELNSGSTELVSRRDTSIQFTPGNGYSELPNDFVPTHHAFREPSIQRMSADGRFVVFVSAASNLAPNDTNGAAQDVFRFDRATGELVLVSINAEGTASGNGESVDPTISDDGNIVAFSSSASDLVHRDQNGRSDVFIRDFSSSTPSTELISVNRAGTGSGNENSIAPAMSGDGTIIAFSSAASDLVTEATNGHYNVFMRNRSQEIPVTELVSINQDGTQGGNASSSSPVVSENGRSIAFASRASDLAANDVNGTSDVFVRDFSAQPPVTELVSTSLDGSRSGRGPSIKPVISADGTRVAFESDAFDLVPDDRNQAADVFVRDVFSDTGGTLLVSMNADGTGSGSGDSGAPSMSSDGSKIAFASFANDLVANDGDTTVDVFVRDLSTVPLTSLVSKNFSGTGSGHGKSFAPMISADGQQVVFVSSASDIVDIGTGTGIGLGAEEHIYATNISSATPTTRLLTINSDGIPVKLNGIFVAFRPILSHDGNFVAFHTASNGLVFGHVNGHMDVLVGNVDENPSLQLASPANASLATQGGNSVSTLAEFGSESQTVSADGRFLAFVSSASDLVANDFNDLDDVFRYDRFTGEIVLVSVDSNGYSSGNGNSANPVISSDGSVIAFQSLANNLVNEGRGPQDIFVRDFSSPTPVTQLISRNHLGTGGGNGPSYDPVISGDGSKIVYESWASDLVPDDLNRSADVFVYDRNSGSVNVRVSVDTVGAGGNNNSSDARISEDGSTVVFVSQASNLVPTDTNGRSDVFVRDVTSGATELISVNAAGTDSGNSHSYGATVSGDGNKIAFVSRSDDLVLVDTNGVADVFVRDRTASEAATQMVSVNPAGDDSGNGESFLPVISANGHVVAFQSFASDLDGEDHNGGRDLYAREISSPSPKTVLISVNSTGTESGDAPSFDPALTADGRFVVFESLAGDLVSGDVNGVRDVFVRELFGNTPQTKLVSTPFPGAGSGNGQSQDAVISGDGRSIFFESQTTNLVEMGELAVGTNIFMSDRGIDQTSPMQVASVRLTGLADAPRPAHGWTPSFLAEVDPVQSLGYEIPTGIIADQIRGLPWSNLNGLVIQFTENIDPNSVSTSSIQLEAMLGSDPGVTGLRVEDDTLTIELNGLAAGAYLKRDTYRLTISDTLRSTDGQPLEGGFSTGDELPTSIDGDSLDDFQFHFRVLPGDIDQSGLVDANDATPVFFGGFFTTPGMNAYSRYADTDGSGLVDANDPTPVFSPDNFLRTAPDMWPDSAALDEFGDEMDSATDPVSQVAEDLPTLGFDLSAETTDKALTQLY